MEDFFGWTFLVVWKFLSLCLEREPQKEELGGCFLFFVFFWNINFVIRIEKVSLRIGQFEPKSQKQLLGKNHLHLLVDSVSHVFDLFTKETKTRSAKDWVDPRLICCQTDI